MVAALSRLPLGREFATRGEDEAALGHLEGLDQLTGILQHLLLGELMADFGWIRSPDGHDLLPPFRRMFLPSGGTVRRVGVGDGHGLDVLQHRVEVDAAATIVDDDRRAGLPDGVRHLLEDLGLELHPGFLLQDRRRGIERIQHNGVGTGLDLGKGIVHKRLIDGVHGFQHAIGTAIDILEELGMAADLGEHPQGAIHEAHHGNLLATGLPQAAHDIDHRLHAAGGAGVHPFDLAVFLRGPDEGVVEVRQGRAAFREQDLLTEVLRLHGEIHQRQETIKAKQVLGRNETGGGHCGVLGPSVIGIAQHPAGGTAHQRCGGHAVGLLVLQGQNDPLEGTQGFTFFGMNGDAHATSSSLRRFLTSSTAWAALGE